MKSFISLNLCYFCLVSVGVPLFDVLTQHDSKWSGLISDSVGGREGEGHGVVVLS